MFVCVCDIFISLRENPFLYTQCVYIYRLLNEAVCVVIVFDLRSRHVQACHRCYSVHYVDIGKTAELPPTAGKRPDAAGTPFFGDGQFRKAALLPTSSLVLAELHTPVWSRASIVHGSRLSQIVVHRLRIYRYDQRHVYGRLRPAGVTCDISEWRLGSKIKTHVYV